MPRKTYTISGEVFRTKDQLKQRIRAIVANYGDNDPLGPGDMAFMTEVLAWHRWRDEKVGVGVSSMTVRTNTPFTSRGFWIIRVDGTSTDFSWVECLDAPSQYKDVMEAMRAAVIDQKTEFRAQFFAANESPVCPLTGEPIAPEDCHVDHVAPLTFAVLAERFLVAHKVDVEAVKIGGFADGEMGKYFLDDDLLRTWQEFHRLNARFRVLSRRGNLSDARREVPPSDDVVLSAQGRLSFD